MPQKTIILTLRLGWNVLKPEEGGGETMFPLRFEGSQTVPGRLFGNNSFERG
jgi:hypothetical protein